MSETKLCPLLLFRGSGDGACFKGRCAWWVEAVPPSSYEAEYYKANIEIPGIPGHCAIPDIGRKP